MEIAKLLEIDHLLDRKPQQLSGGQKQRVALGRAILSNPSLLILDEPFTGLDIELKRQILPYIKRLHEKTQVPMILVSHNPEEMTELAEHMIFIEKGSITAQGKLHRANPVQSATKTGLCGHNNPESFKNTRNLLIRNHGLRFPGTNEFSAAF